MGTSENTREDSGDEEELGSSSSKKDSNSGSEVMVTNEFEKTSSSTETESIHDEKNILAKNVKGVFMH